MSDICTYWDADTSKKDIAKKVSPFIFDKTRMEVDSVKVAVSTNIQNIIDIS